MRRLALLACAVLALAGCLRAPELAERSTPAPDGVPIHYVAGGSGATALVFVHGWSCDATYWREQLPVFARTHRVVAVDLAGHGRSGSDRERFTIAAFGADVAAVVTAEKLDRVVLLGHSMGGPVALAAAALLPGTTRLVVGVDTLHDAAAEWPEEDYRRMRDAMAADFPAAVEGFVRGMFLPDADPALVASIVADMAAAPPRVALSAMDELQQLEGGPLLAGAGVPVACLNAAVWPTNLESNRRWARAFEAEILSGVGHFPMLEQPLRFNDALGRLLGRSGHGG